jgi:hypothetical protein
MNKYIIIAVCLFILNGCFNNSDKMNATEKKTTVDSFFPVTSYLKGQIIILDSLPITPLQITTIKGKSDSVWIPKNDMKKLLDPFLSATINETNLVEFFTETKFNDQTLNAITFTYDPSRIIPDSISLRHWDIYINPETGIVEKVYIVKNSKEGKNNFTQQLTWKSNEMAKITTILNKEDGNKELLKEVVYTWKF